MTDCVRRIEVEPGVYPYCRCPTCRKQMQAMRAQLEEYMARRQLGVCVKCGNHPAVHVDRFCTQCWQPEQQ